MRVLLVALCATAALTTACSSHQSAAPHKDAYAALQPPAPPTVSGLDPALVRRALDATHGLLAQSLAEPTTLLGSGTADLIGVLKVSNAALDITSTLQPPSRKGLDIRPLFARTVTLDADPVTVVRSHYAADQVQSLNGDRGVRVTWSGEVRYRVQVEAAPRQVDYVQTIAYIFGLVPNDPLGLRLEQVVPGSATASPVVTACLAKGVLLPGPAADPCPL